MAKAKSFSILMVLALLLSLGMVMLPQGAVLADPPAWWAKTYGGDRAESAYSIQQTQGGGYIVAGVTNSFGAAGYDFWLLKLDSGGNVTWQKTYGGSNNEFPYSIQQTQDGGYIVAGATASFGVSSADFWLLKLDSNGNVTWQKTYGGSERDEAYSIQETQDGGYIVAGATWSFGVSNADFWLLKLDSNGNVTWQKTYGGSERDEAYSIQETQDGGYIVAGYTESFGAGSEDFWVLKLDSSGNVTWQKTYGGSDGDRASSIQDTSGGYIVAGWTESFGAGSDDFWVLRLNSNGNVIWQKTYGGSDGDRASSIQDTSDGYIVAGWTVSFGAGSEDFWVLRLDSNGNVAWQKTYGGTSGDWAYSIQEAQDGGYIVAGETDSFGAGWGDFWVLKLDDNGLIGPQCPLGVDSQAHITHTAVPGEDTSVDGVVSDAEIDSPAHETSDTDCTVETQCYYSLPILSITKSDSSDPVDVGSQFTYTINYENTGPGKATGVVVTEDYDPGVEFVSASPPPDAGTNATWTIGDLAAGASGTIAITVRVRSSAVHNHVAIACDQAVSDSTSEDTAVTCAAAPPATVPAISEWGAGMIIALAVCLVWALRKRRALPSQ